VPSTLARHGTVINDWFSHGTLRLTAAGALALSSNIGTVLAAERMPSRELYRYLRDFGLGSRTGVELPGESAGLLNAGKDWRALNHDTIAFGQGLSVNALQMTAAIAAVANGGRYVQPSLISGYVDEDGSITPQDPAPTHRVIREDSARQVARMMEEVTGDEGTAPAARINGYRVAGKTGTAQRVDPESGLYNGFTVSFAGFAPADDPRFAVYVVVQDPKDGNGGGSTGGPVFHDLMSAALEKYGVPPTGVRAPKMPVTW
jgi:cell division protein FtsI (penicillin-binding protein 3)